MSSEELRKKGKRKRLKVAVLMGGRSAEREISLMTGNQIAEALAGKGYKVTKIEADENVWEKVKKEKPDVVFIALHGRFGEDGTVQGMLELLGIPYTGSGVLASALGINKIQAKNVFQAESIRTPEFKVFNKQEFEQKGMAQISSEVEKKPGFSLVIKPCREGSTIGVSAVKKKEDLRKALQEAFKYDEELLVEEFVRGKLVTVGILGNRNPLALPTLEIVSKRELYDYEAKYTPGLSEHIIPARLPKAQRKAAQKLALKAHKALGCRGFSRVDLIVSEEGLPYVLEINTIPGMTELSLFPDAARAVGIEFPDLVEKLIHLALEKS